MAEELKLVGQPANLRQAYQERLAQAGPETERLRVALAELSERVESDCYEREVLLAREEADYLAALHQRKEQLARQREQDEVPVARQAHALAVAEVQENLLDALVALTGVLESPGLSDADPRQRGLLHTLCEAVRIVVRAIEGGSDLDRVDALKDRLLEVQGVAGTQWTSREPV